MDKLFIVIPAYNEEENIRQVVEDWYPVVKKHNGFFVGADEGNRTLDLALGRPCFTIKLHPQEKNIVLHIV